MEPLDANAGKDARPLGNVLSAPFIYSVAIPIALLDLWVTVYQEICFRLYGISRVERSQFVVIDRQRLPYLDPIQKLNCVYCGYASGVLAYAREIAASTEQYWCPIKHERSRPGAHARSARFLEYGDAVDFLDRQALLRAELAADDSDDVPSPTITMEATQ